MQNALVTGGTRGIGKAIVEEFVKNNFFVTFTYCSHEKEAMQLIETLGKDRVAAIKCALDNQEDIDKLYETMEKLDSPLDVLVNNAGITMDNWFSMMSMETFETVINTNLLGTARITKRFVKKMVARKAGVIINISSIGGISAPEGQTNYAASKAGIIAFTKSLAREMGKYNVRVVGIAPGFVKTDMYAKIPSELKNRQIENVALKRPAEPGEIAKVAVFLASEGASYITGTTIVVDGGLV